jgi:hypothetical protein
MPAIPFSPEASPSTSAWKHWNMAKIALNLRTKEIHDKIRTILNSEHIGLTLEQFVQMWNDNHPEEPITFSEN